MSTALNAGFDMLRDSQRVSSLWLDALDFESSDIFILPGGGGGGMGSNNATQGGYTADGVPSEIERMIIKIARDLLTLAA